MRNGNAESVLFCLILAGAGCLALARWVLLPMHRAAWERGRTADGRWRAVQFRMGDLLFLVFYSSLGLGLVVAANRLLFQNLPGEEISYWELQFFGSALLMCFALWWLGISLLARANVGNRWRRMLFFLSLPLIYAASFVVALAGASAMRAITADAPGTLFMEEGCCISPLLVNLLLVVYLVVDRVAASGLPAEGRPTPGPQEEAGKTMQSTRDKL